MTKKRRQAEFPLPPPKTLCGYMIADGTILMNWSSLKSAQMYMEQCRTYKKLFPPGRLVIETRSWSEIE